MDPTGPTLLRRALAVLRAKQYLVFYAIPVYALTVGAPLALSWLRDGGTTDEVVERARAPFYDVAAAPGLLALAAVAVYLAIFIWFRAGYIRSIVGRFHARPQDGGQFASLLGLQVIIEAVNGLGVWAIVATEDGTVATLTGIVVFIVSIAIMYADYAIVITGLDPLRAIARSWTCVGANLVLSAAVVLIVNLIGMLGAALLAQSVSNGLPQALPVLVIYVVVMGVVTFVADVILVTAYVRAIETGRLPHAR